MNWVKYTSKYGRPIATIAGAIDKKCTGPTIVAIDLPFIEYIF